ncbi:conserved exported hypothetical protein [Rubrivivax sp. A210]|uniref:hypothetical protein n=1 Tax=Rubrivivax sp. A210 TaxID=2772301 RepID=UPI001918F5FA|nr:hypothetical protein [Rubrivivax sp. A210]CAD5374964.1 conserved exported hypothetical protein [Rubrivivax sp. A210]
MRPFPRLVATLLLAGCAAGVGAQGQVADGLKPRAVAAPHYGDTLYQFYQGRHFEALTGLMVSQHFGRVAPHDDEAEVLRGGMLLSYGLHDEASAVFARLIERQAPPSVRDRAWYFLARIRHQRGLNDQAEAALALILAPLHAALEEERRLLQAQLLLQREDYAGAAALLEPLKGSAGAGLYARFNLGVALVKSGDAEGGQALLDEVGQAPGADEEMRGLRDRANVALGFTALQDKKPREARAALQRVRLNAAQSNKALLGYGWAAAELNDPRLALVPWTELAQRPLSDAAVLEAQIAVPYALAEIGAFGQALDKYGQAVDAFAREREALAQTIAAVRGGALVRALMAGGQAGESESGLAAFAGVERLPELPHSGHLAPLLAGHAFQESYKNLRDLQFLQRNLGRWQGNLVSFADMLEARGRAYAERLPRVRAAAGAMDLPALVLRQAALQQDLDRALEHGHAAAFADARELALQQRIDSARAALRRAGDDPEAGAAAERLRRITGALAWQQARELPARSWQARKGLRESERTLAAAQARDAALLQAQRDEPARQARFAARIAALTAALVGLQPRIAALDAEVGRQMQEAVVAELEAQQQRLDVYAAQARLAMAQIHDRAQLARRSDGTFAK